MREIISAMGAGIGQGLAEGIGRAFILIIMIVVISAAIAILLGIIFLGLSYFAFKRKKPKLFLTFSLLATLFLSVILSLIIGTSITNNIVGALIPFPFLFGFGIWKSIKKYKKIKSAE
ncbi:hypothetical protein GW950_01115 [Candidatus Wolfebacteria bacterium]|nr:hypothetical protein [Candidatus Wolfebacteria bacterium]